MVGPVMYAQFCVSRDVGGAYVAIVGKDGVDMEVGIPVSEVFVDVRQEAGGVVIWVFVNGRGGAVDGGCVVGKGICELESVRTGVGVGDNASSVWA